MRKRIFSSPKLAGLLFLALAGISFGQTKPKDVDGWSKIKWGMSVSEAKGAFGEQASDSDSATVPGSNPPLIDRLTIRDIRIGEVIATASIQTARNSDVVAAVEIDAGGPLKGSVGKRSDLFSGLKRLLIEKYGVPQNEDRASSSRGVVASVVLWVFPSTSITLRWSEVTGYDLGSVTIQYKAVDKKALDSL